MMYEMEVQKTYTTIVKINAVSDEDAYKLAEQIAQMGESWQEGETRTDVIAKRDILFASDYDLVKAYRKKHNRDGELPQLKNRDILELRGIEDLMVVDGIAISTSGTWIATNQYDKYGLFKGDDTYYCDQDDPRRWDIKRVLRFGIDGTEPGPIWESIDDDRYLEQRRNITGQNREDD